MGQNERTANYGTSVESCSDSSRSAPAVKLRISPSAAYNDRKGILPKNVDNFFEKMGVKKRLAMQTVQKNILDLWKTIENFRFVLYNVHKSKTMCWIEKRLSFLCRFDKGNFTERT